MEKIICAAIHVKHNQQHAGQPVNIETGFVVCGRRHDACHTTIAILNPSFLKLLTSGDNGFVTTKNKFVDRKEGYVIAKDAGQLLHNYHDSTNLILTSEDLWYDDIDLPKMDIDEKAN